MNIDTIFRLTPYIYRNHRWDKDKRQRYPNFKIRGDESVYFRSKEEAEAEMPHLSSFDTYCWVLSELPLGVRFFHENSFSERVYLPDGQLWSERLYADMFPSDIPAQYGELEFDNYLYGRNFFAGRKPEEIRFKPGDLIEIFCYGGNFYWSDGNVELAIVLDTPPTVDEMSEKVEHFLKTDSSLTGDRGFDLGTMFNVTYDAYAVVPAYIFPEHECDPVDFCPTHCAMTPRMDKVSTRMRNKLERWREKVMENEEWKKKFIRRLKP